MARPDGITITLPTHNVAYKLLDRLIAAAPKVMSDVRQVQAVNIQMDVDGGATRYYIGGPNLASNMCSHVFFATQIVSKEVPQHDKLGLASIYVMADTDSSIMNVEVVFPGVDP